MTGPMLLLVPLVDDVPPIEAGRLEDGRRGATMRSLCATLEIARNGQIVRIRRNPKLAKALISMRVQTSGGWQRVDILLDWAIPIWAAGLNISRLPEAKRAAAAILQQYAFAAIERAFAQFDSPASAPPPPSEAPAPQPVWREGHAFLDHLEAEFGGLPHEVHEVRQEQQETHSHQSAMAHDLQDLKERVTILEGGSARPVIGASPQRLAHLYLLANRVRQRHGYRIAETLEALVAHVQVGDVYDLPESAWPAILDWFASLLED